MRPVLTAALLVAASAVGAFITREAASTVVPSLGMLAGGILALAIGWGCLALPPASLPFKIGRPVALAIFGASILLAAVTFRAGTMVGVVSSVAYGLSLLLLWLSRSPRRPDRPTHGSPQAGGLS